jgi:TolB-like protein/Flp pilus assembly protein TadD
MNFIAELKRRNVIRMAGLYLVGAWLITQVAATLLPVFEAPNWVMKTLVGILAVGFIPAMIFAWVFELTPDGLKRDSEIPEQQSIAPQTAQKMNRLIVTLLLIAVAYFGFDKFYLAPKREAALVSTATQAITEKVASQEKSENAKSIAVLAFENRSADKNNEYFSDGVAEEILNSLAKVKDLKVAGRTSSFFFKGKNESLSAIGKALGVAHVLEGSVRKQGDKLRITAQLIRVSDGFQLWSETFDGNDADIFALQEKIAQQVTSELKVALNAGQQNRLIDVGTSSPEAYALYLQATAIFNRRDFAQYQDAVTALQKALVLDPNYARAYSRLATMYVLLANSSKEPLQSLKEKVLANAKAASALDPSLAEPYAALGASFDWFTGELIEQREMFDRALALDPDDVTSNFWYGLMMIRMGYLERGVAHIDRALDKEPMLPNALRWRGIMYFHAGEYAKAETFLNRARNLGLKFSDRNLADIASARGNKIEAINLSANGTILPFMPPNSARVLSEGIYGDATQRTQALTLLDNYMATSKAHLPGMVPVYLFMLGEPDKALNTVHKRLLRDKIDFLALLWSPQGKAMRELPEFPQFLHDSGLVELWDKYGAPDICKKNDKGNYVCE